MERGEEEQQPDDRSLLHLACDKGSTGLCWFYNSMCMSRSDIRTAAGGRSTFISHLELDAKEVDDAVGQETLPLVSVWIHV